MKLFYIKDFLGRIEKSSYI